MPKKTEKSKSGPPRPMPKPAPRPTADGEVSQKIVKGAKVDLINAVTGNPIKRGLRVRKVADDGGSAWVEGSLNALSMNVLRPEVKG